ncbi:MAG: VCBS repeat-containing protein [Planctomycetota bacterium]
MDLFTGCFEGGVYVLAGKKEGGYASPEPLKDRAGRILRLGQYWDYERKAWTGVADSKFKDFLGIGVASVDWDADGDLDLVIGSNDGHLFVRQNEGTSNKPAFATESTEILAGKTALRVPGEHLIPFVVDWNGDGLFDVLSGGGEGGVFWFANVGKKGAPEFAAPQTVIEPKRGAAAPGEPTWPGTRTQVCATDFDGDGDLDLLVGDYNEQQAGGQQSARHGWVWLFRRK